MVGRKAAEGKGSTTWGLRGRRYYPMYQSVVVSSWGWDVRRLAPDAKLTAYILTNLKYCGMLNYGVR